METHNALWNISQMYWLQITIGRIAAGVSAIVFVSPYSIEITE